MVETPIPLLDMPEDNYTDPKFATVYSKVKSVTSLGKHDLLYSLNASSDNLFISAFTPISSLAFGTVQSMKNLNRLSQSAILLFSSPGSKHCMSGSAGNVCATTAPWPFYWCAFCSCVICACYCAMICTSWSIVGGAAIFTIIISPRD